MHNENVKAIELETKTITNERMETVRSKVKKWWESGYTTMAVMYYLSEEFESVSGSLKGDKFVINID